MPAIPRRGLRGLGWIPSMGSESAMRSSTGATSRAAADAAANEIGALDERAKQDLLDGRGKRSVRMAIESEGRQAGEIADRWEHMRRGSFCQPLEFIQPLARVAAPALVHGRTAAPGARTVGRHPQRTDAPDQDHR